MAANADIGGESEREMFGHLIRARGSPDLERHVALAPGHADPAGEPEIGETHHVVRMVMGEKHGGDIAEGNPELEQALQSAAPRIE